MAAKKPVRKTTVSSRSTKPRTSGKGRKTTSAKPKTVPRTTTVAPVKTFMDHIVEYRKFLQGDHVYVLDLPFEDRQFARTIGAKWHQHLRQWLFISDRLEFVARDNRIDLAHYRSKEFSLERWIEQELNNDVRIPSYPATFKPRQHQVDAIKKIYNSAKAGYRGMILADQTGLGKTLSALLGAYKVAELKGFTKQNPAKLLIIGPKAVIPHWRNTIRASGVDNLRIVVINYDQAKKLLDIPPTAEEAKRQRTKNKRTALHGNPTIQWDIIIADESHKLKNVSQRTNSFNRIARYASQPEQAPFIIWASATIGQQPLEVAYLAPLISQLSGERSITIKEFGKWLIAKGFHVKEGSGGSYSWIKARADMSEEQKYEVEQQQLEDVQRLSELLFSPKSPSIRRSPEDISGWPKQTHIPVPIELNHAEQTEYAKLWTEFRQAMNLTPRGKNPAGGLAATLRFRQKASLLTAPYTADYAEELLENGIQVAISVQFIETLDLLKERLEKAKYKVSEFSGRNEKDREEQRLLFQRGETQVIIFTVEEAVSFHANETLPDGSKATSNTRATLLHDVRYSGIALTQILGRATRDGELSNAYYMYASNTIEEKILDTMLRKVKNIKTLSGDDADSSQEIFDILDGLK